MDNRCATLAFIHGITKTSIFLLLHDIHGAAYSWGSHDKWDSFCKLLFIKDNQGYLVLVIALDSIYMNLDNNVA